ncbi:MAG TPA: hypothetical protein VGL75_03320 [Acidothermaceae bacterium]|jgi:hypothetical protein
MDIGQLRDFVGEWELEVGLPGADGLRGRVVFEALGGVLVQRTYVPVPEAPDSVCVVVATEAGFVQHYFDSRGVARLYAMTFDGTTLVLERTEADFSPLDFCQRYVGTFGDDRRTIDGEWQTSEDGREWRRDFHLSYRRV